MLKRTLLDTRDHEGNGAIHTATYHNHPDCINLLVLAGASIFIINRRQETCLHIAAEDGRWGLAVFLLMSHVDINARREFGDTALHIAVRKGFFTMVDMLLKCGADTTIPNGSDMTALEMAITWQYEDIHALILNHITSRW